MENGFEERRAWRTMATATVLPLGLIVGATGCSAPEPAQVVDVPLFQDTPLQSSESTFPVTDPTPSATYAPPTTWSPEPSVTAPAQPSAAPTTETLQPRQGLPLNERILQASYQLTGLPYNYTGGNRGHEAFSKGCPDPQKAVKLQKGLAGCAVSCSGLVNIAFYNVTGIDLKYSTRDYRSGSKHLREIPWSEVRPGNVGVESGHMALVLAKVDGKHGWVKTVEAHYPGKLSDISQNKFPRFYEMTA